MLLPSLFERGYALQNLVHYVGYEKQKIFKNSCKYANEKNQEGANHFTSLVLTTKKLYKKSSLRKNKSRPA